MTTRNAIEEAKKGSAELVVLSLLDEQARHGYEIAKLIATRTNGALTFNFASLYATIYRLEERGLVRGRWLEAPNQRRRRYYRITEKGRKILAAQRQEWAQFFELVRGLGGLSNA
jgi:DNA-binding PadR family transcriptional regulator